MSAELLGERGLVVLEPLVVVWAEPHRVLVRHVNTLDGRCLVRVHLLGELARDLDWLHAGAEGTAEHAFDEALDAGFKVAQDADLRLLFSRLLSCRVDARARVSATRLMLGPLRNASGPPRGSRDPPG